jgi:hypothetical protein
MELEAQASQGLAERSRPKRTAAPAGAHAEHGCSRPGTRGAFVAAAEAAQRQRRARLVALGLYLGLCLLSFLVLLRSAPDVGLAQAPPPLVKKGPPPLFSGWDNPRPDVVIAISGDMRGYLQPCGCSSPQFGGLARRYNFLQGLRQRGWPVVAVDLGDVAQSANGPQKEVKYRKAMEALNLMDYAAVGVGKNEMAMPLIAALANYTLNNPSPAVVAANLLKRDKGEPFDGLIKSGTVVGKGTAPRVGVIGLVGPSVKEKANDPLVQLHPKTSAVLQQELKNLQAQRAQLVVVLYQGSLREAKACAEFCQTLKGLPNVDVIVCPEEDIPPGAPEVVGRTQIVRIGDKGRFLGVIGAFRLGQAGAPYALRYQLVSIGEEYETPNGKEKSNPIIELMEDYAREIKSGNYMSKFPHSLHPVQIAFPQSAYVGTEQCKDCHAHAHAIWSESKHASAYAKLVVKAKRPSLRQFDGECLSCHVVGFQFKTGFTDEKATPHLLNVGCESCHGPCSEHINKPRNLQVRAAINPWKANPANATPAANHQRLLQIDHFCQSCHDSENDVHWQFDKAWPKVIHMMPRPGGAPAPGAAAPAPQAGPAFGAPPGPALAPPRVLQLQPRQP